MPADPILRSPRLYLAEADLSPGAETALSEAQAHYLLHVLRRGEGDVVRVFNGREGEWQAVLHRNGKRGASLSLGQCLRPQRARRPITVACSPIKKDAFDTAIQKSCELGVSLFIPVICEHTVIHKMNEARLQAIAVEAAEQSERLDVMKVESPISLKNLFGKDFQHIDFIFCVERTGAATIMQKLKQIKSDNCGVLIGPEGGFSEQEIDLVQKHKNFHAVSLGESVLRTETALMAALSCLYLST